MTEFSISASSQKELLQLARKAVEEYLKNYEVIDFSIDHNEEMMQPAAVFVTLTKNGNLRGCIGTTEPEYSLCEAVIRMALSAALNDTRFPQVTLKELPEINIEISVLSPMQKVSSADAVIPGKHGVMVRKGNRSGLFLPQVWEHFDSKEEFMDELCSQKAGLPEECWKDGSAEIYIFTVFSFEE